MEIYYDILGEEEVQLFEDGVHVEEISIENITRQNAWMELLFDFDAALQRHWKLTLLRWIYLSVTVNFTVPGHAP